MPTVHHPSWEHLSAALSSIGIHQEALRETKAGLDRTGSHTITEVRLSDDQLTKLGFVDAAACRDADALATKARNVSRFVIVEDLQQRFR